MTTHPEQQAQAEPWPEGVTYRYATHLGTTIDIRNLQNDSISAKCAGCPWDIHGDEYYVHNDAQAHAERCRALPRPAVTA